MYVRVPGSAVLRNSNAAVPLASVVPSAIVVPSALTVTAPVRSAGAPVGVTATVKADLSP